VTGSQGAILIYRAASTPHLTKDGTVIARWNDPAEKNSILSAAVEYSGWPSPSTATGTCS
jgi:hypothetical protein